MHSSQFRTKHYGDNTSKILQKMMFFTVSLNSPLQSFCLQAQMMTSKPSFMLAPISVTLFRVDLTVTPTWQLIKWSVLRSCWLNCLSAAWYVQIIWNLVLDSRHKIQINDIKTKQKWNQTVLHEIVKVYYTLYNTEK